MPRKTQRKKLEDAKPLKVDGRLVPIPPSTGRLSVDLPIELLEELRDLVCWELINGMPLSTLKGVVRRYVEAGLDRDRKTLREKHKVEEIPPRKIRILPQGRRISL